MKKSSILMMIVAVATTAAVIRPVMAEDVLAKTEDAGQESPGNPTPGSTETSAQKGSGEEVVGNASDSAKMSQGLYSELTPEERQEMIDDMKKQPEDKKCEMVKANVASRAQYYSANTYKIINQYEGAVASVENAIARLQQLGVDTKNVEQKLLQVKVMVQEMNQIHTQLQNSLQQASDVACDEDGGQLKQSASLAQTEVKNMRQQALKIHNYLGNELKMALQELKLELV